MIKLFILSMILPVLAGSTAGQAGLREHYPKKIIFKENTSTTFPAEVQTFINDAFKEKNCNPFVTYKIQKESTYPISDLHGETTFVYSLELRAFGEADQKSFNGYEGTKKFRTRNITIRKNKNSLSTAELSCETISAQK